MTTRLCTTCLLVQPCDCRFGRQRPRTLADIAADEAAQFRANTRDAERIAREHGEQVARDRVERAVLRKAGRSAELEKKAAYARILRGPARVPKPCEHCGRVFTPRDKRNYACSPKCSEARKNARRPLTSGLPRGSRVTVARARRVA